MNRLMRYGPVLAVMALTGIAAGTPGAAQTTSTATPLVATPTRTPGAAPLPSGPALIASMRKAMVARGTVRIGETSTTRWAGHLAVGWTWMDMDLRANALREIDTIQRLKPGARSISFSVWRRELVVSDGKSANRRPGGRWTCENLPRVHVRDSLIAFQIPAAKALTIGDTVTQGQHVWHVVVIDASSPGNSAKVDLYISRADRTLVRLDAALRTQAGGTTTREALTDSFTRYADPISVDVPAQCR